MAGFNLNSGGVLNNLPNTGVGKFIVRYGVLVPGVSRLIVTTTSTPAATSDIGFVSAVAQASIGNISGVASDNIGSIDNITF